MNRQTVAALALALIVWTGVGVCLGLGIGFFAYVQKPRVFQSSALVQVSQPDSDAQRLQSSSINSEANVLAAIRSARLDRLPDFKTDGRRPTQDELLSRLLDGRIQVVPEDSSHGDAAFRVACLAATPSASQKVVQTLIEEYRKRLLAANYQDQLSTAIAEFKEHPIEDNSNKDSITDSKPKISSPPQESASQPSRESQKSLKSPSSKPPSSTGESDSPLNVDGAESPPQFVSHRAAPKAPPAISVSALTTRQKQINSRINSLRRDYNQLGDRLGKAHPTMKAISTEIEYLEQEFERLSILADAHAKRANETKKAKSETQNHAGNQSSEQRMESLVRRHSELVDELARTQQDIVEAVVEKPSDALDESKRAFHELRLADPTSVISPAPAKRSLSIISAPQPGVQVAPHLDPFLFRGGVTGASIGLVVSILLVLISLATQPIRNSCEPKTA